MLNEEGPLHSIADENAAGRHRRRELAAVYDAGTPMSISSPPRGAGQFAIELKFISPSTTSAQKASFQYAADRLSKLILTKHAPLAVPSSMRCSYARNVALPNTVTDMLVMVEIGKGDSVSGMLAWAAPCLADSNGFPRVGYIFVDEADVGILSISGTLDSDCLHEMMHVIGFASLWSKLGLSKGQRYIGPGGIRGMNKLAPGNSNTWGDTIPQYNGHWDDKLFDTELMTTYATSPNRQLSIMSVEALTDLGYEVDLSAADEYTKYYTAAPSLSPTFTPPSSRPTFVGDSNTTATDTSLTSDEAAADDNTYATSGLGVIPIAIMCVACVMIVAGIVACCMWRSHRCCRAKKTPTSAANEKEVPASSTFSPSTWSTSLSTLPKFSSWNSTNPTSPPPPQHHGGSGEGPAAASNSNNSDDAVKPQQQQASVVALV